MSKLLPNLPLDCLSVENDYLNVLPKANIIKSFLVNNVEIISKIKMFSLYGEWGSGKSSLMKYLEKELNDDFNTFFFEAWEFESDSNLPLSLLEYLALKSTDATEEAIGELLSVSQKLLRGFLKSTKVSFPLGVSSLEFDGEKLDEEIFSKREKSFFELKNSFKKEFLKWEDQTTKLKTKKYNIVFIDDLDRCEPENVLNLLSALKLFFTYGQKTIFLCGIDKIAVKQAVKTKYGNIVKSNEYLEKIFDISFTMPKHDSVHKLIGLFFDDRTIYGKEEELDENLSRFFYDLGLTNPRKLKKVLNKFQILRMIQNGLSKDDKYYDVFPNIYNEDKGNYFETVLAIYFIILHEFYPKKFKELLDFVKKEAVYKEVIEKKHSNNNSVLSNSNNKLNQLLKANIANSSFNDPKFALIFENLAFALGPLNVRFLSNVSFNDTYFIDYFKVYEQDVEFIFLKYLLFNKQMLVINKSKFSSCTLKILKEIINNVL